MLSFSGTEPERRRRLLEGTIFHFAPCPETEALVDYVWRALVDTYPESHPRDAQRHLSNEIIFGRLTSLRRSLVTPPGVDAVMELIRDVLKVFGCDLRYTYFDLLRLRAVQSDGASRPEAANAYHLHRDCWYANPPMQTNWWIPLHDVLPQESVAFYLDYFRRPVRNGSRLFDYRHFQQLGGWQRPHPAKIYPHLEEAIEAVPRRIPCRRAEPLLFSGSHLHGTTNHRTGRIRFSVELRTVHLEDLGAPDRFERLDDESRGTTLGDYRRASDFTLLPNEIVRDYLQAIVARKRGRRAPI